MAGSEDILMRCSVLQATISVLTLTAAFGPAHHRECEPVIADLHKAIIERGEGCSYIAISPDFMQRIIDRLRYSNHSWQWLRDIYRKALEDKKAGLC